MPETLQSIMAELRSRINTEDTTTKVYPREIEALKAKTQVVMPSGGKGTRIRSETQNEGINKVMISVDGKESMIEKLIGDYARAGFKRFVVLSGYLADKLRAHLGNGSRWGVEIRYSDDPNGVKVGNAGAILNALNNGAMNDSLSAIVHNPDDVIVGMNRSYGDVFLEGHLRGRKNSCIATYVVVPESPYQYSGLIIKKGKVVDTSKYPLIAVPAHTGITVFDPEVYGYFRQLVSLEAESSFESVVSPTLVGLGVLFAVNIPSDNWIPVNSLKELEVAREALSKFSRG